MAAHKCSKPKMKGDNTLNIDTIDTLRADLSTKFDGILTTIDGVREELRECSECVTQAKLRISTAAYCTTK